MIILTVIKFDIDHFIQWGMRICSMAICVMMGWLILLLLWHPKSTVQMQEADEKIGYSDNAYPLDAIGSGPLALHPRIACGWVSRIADEFCVVGFNSRPDAIQKDAKILVSLKGDKDQVIINNGKVIFLQERNEGKGLRLSEGETSLWLKPILLDNGNVLVEVGRKLLSKDGELTGEETSEFIASPAGNASLRPQNSQAASLMELKGAKHLGQDPLIIKYGGREYSSWKDKIKIEFSISSRTYAAFVSAGDLLQYQDGEWRVVAPDALNAQLPLARVLSATSKVVALEGWDESGFFSIQAKIETQKTPPAPVNSDLLPSSLRMRSNTQVSCLFGKKRVILKKGDWLLRTPLGWRTLRRATEIEDCLMHRIKGELFIFDGIEKQGGKCLLQGHLFDISRSNASPISLPIDPDKKSTQKMNKKGKRLFSCNPVSKEGGQV